MRAFWNIHADSDPQKRMFGAGDTSFSAEQCDRQTHPNMVNIETKNTWHRPDPSFTHLLSFFLLLTALAWGLAYTPGFGSIVKLTFMFIFVHFLGSSLLVATLMYFLVGRFLGPGIAGLPGRRRQQGLFTSPADRDQLEFGYCFDVSPRHWIEREAKQFHFWGSWQFVC